MGMPETRGRTRATEKETEKKNTKLEILSLRNRVWVHCGFAMGYQLGQSQSLKWDLQHSRELLQPEIRIHLHNHCQQAFGFPGQHPLLCLGHPSSPIVLSCWQLFQIFTQLMTLSHTIYPGVPVGNMAWENWDFDEDRPRGM